MHQPGITLELPRLAVATFSGQEKHAWQFDKRSVKRD